MMPLWSKKEIAELLIARFNLASRKELPTDFPLWPAILLQTSLDSLQQTAKMATATLSLVSASGFTTHANLTVPLRKRWRLWYVMRPATTAATTVIVATTAGATWWIAISGSGTSLDRDNAVGFLMQPGWVVALKNTGNAGDSARDLIISYIEEDYL